MSTISTSGIAPSSVIRAEHVLRVINALSNVANNDILITGSLTVTGSTALSGSLNVVGGITGSIFGTSSNATSASYALNSTSASYTLNATSSSYALNSTSASYALRSTSASYSTVAQTLLGSVVSSSYALTASYALNGGGGGAAFPYTGSAEILGSLKTTEFLQSTTIQGTGSLYLKPDLNDSRYFEIYNTAPSDTHIKASGGLSFFGDDTNYLKIDDSLSDITVRANQDVLIQTGNGDIVLDADGSSYVGSAAAGNEIVTTNNLNGIVGDTNIINNSTGHTITDVIFNISKYATTGSNTFSGSQTITGSVSITGSQSITGSIDLNGGTFTTLAGDSLMSIYSNIITIENQESPFNYTLLGQGVLSYNSASNAQQLLFPASLTTGIKTITLPNDTGTVALTYNTAITGSNTFTGNQTINANLILSASRTMSIVSPLAETYVTEGQVSISPNYSGADQATLSGGSLSLSRANGTSTIVLTNRNSPATSGDHLASLTFRGKTSDTNSGIKGGIRATTVGGTNSNMSLNLYTSASGFGGSFTTGDLDMRISSGSSIELFRNTAITGSVSITNVLTLTPNDPLPSAQPTGSISVSGSGADCKPYFYNGTTWTSMI